MNLDGLGKAGAFAASEYGLDLVVLLLVYLNPRSPPGEVTPPRRVGALRPVAAITASHAVQWSGICAVAAAGLEPRSLESVLAFGVTWLLGLATAAQLFRKLLLRHCAIDAASARELVIAKLLVHGVVWLVACIYTRVMI